MKLLQCIGDHNQRTNVVINWGSITFKTIRMGQTLLITTFKYVDN